MSKASADTDAIRKFAKQVKSYVSEQEALIGKLKSQYASVNSQWNDMQYQRFGASLAELEKSVKKQAPAFHDYAKRLENKAKQIDIYLER